jgi:hypothetical protein
MVGQYGCKGTSGIGQAVAGSALYKIQKDVVIARRSRFNRQRGTDSVPITFPVRDHEVLLLLLDTDLLKFARSLSNSSTRSADNASPKFRKTLNPTAPARS